MYRGNGQNLGNRMSSFRFIYKTIWPHEYNALAPEADGRGHKYCGYTQIEDYSTPWGFRSSVLDQDKDEQKQQQQKKGGEKKESALPEDNEPRGKCAEGICLNVGDHASMPVLIGKVDRRPENNVWDVAPGGSIQFDAKKQVMYLHPEKGAFIATLDTAASQGQQEVNRMASLRHVEKQEQKVLSKEQEKEAQKNKNREHFKHEGETVNAEVRVTKNRISFFADDAEVGYYDKPNKTWVFIGNVKLGSASADHVLRVAKDAAEKYADVTDTKVFAPGGTDDPD